MNTSHIRMKLERRSGISLWRQVADAIRQQLLATLEPGARLPAEAELASRFGVNRHTVRAAIAALETEGILRAEQGRGTFLANRRRLRYPIGKRTRLSAGLSDQTTRFEGHIVSSRTETARTDIAAALGLSPGAEVERLETVSSADGMPVSHGISWFDSARLRGIADHYAETGSVTQALARLGIADYTRQFTVITAAHAAADDLALLRLSPGAIVLLTRAVNVDPDGTPFQYSETRFAADRMEFVVGDAEI